MTCSSIVTTLVDTAVRDRTALWLRRVGARLPTFAELANPSIIPEAIIATLRTVDQDRPDPANLFRVHWYNDRSRSGFAATTEHLVLLRELTGIPSPIVVALGCLF